jgi:hypothetical protein
LSDFGGSSFPTTLLFAVISVIVALSSMMNIKGKDVQGEANPHNIMKARREGE